MSTADDLRKQVTSSSFGLALQSADAVGRINGKMPRSLAEAELPMGRSFIVKSGRTFMIQVATPYTSDDAIETSLDDWVKRITERCRVTKPAWSHQAETDANANREAAELETIRQKLREIGVTDELMAAMGPADLRSMAEAYGIQV
jgi:hypothetical protein